MSSWPAVAESKRLLLLAMPLFAVGVLQYAVQAISLMFVGHVGESDLAGAALSASFTAVTGFNVLLGMALGLETLSGQAYGADEKNMVGVLMQRAMIVITAMSVLISLIWANAAKILLWFHQSPEIANKAGDYARFMIPSIFAYGQLQCLGKFLQIQNNILPMVFTSAIALLLHALVCWLLVFHSKLGFRGAALSVSASYSINAFLLALYVKFSSNCKSTWTGFSVLALHNISTYLKIAVPATLMTCCKTWTFEAMIILSGLLPNPKRETSVISICFNTFSMAWMIPYSLTAAVSTRVSNELGAGRPQAARLAAKAVLRMAVIEAMLIAVVMIAVRHVWGNVYTNQKEVIANVASMMPIVAFMSSLDTVQSVLTGVAHFVLFFVIQKSEAGISTGCGWQSIGAGINLVAFTGVGIPVAIVLSFVLRLKGKGLMLGVASALVVQSCLLLISTLRTDWDKQATKAANRIQDDSVSISTVQS